MNYSPQGIEYRMAVINLIEPINPALTTPFLIYKDAVQGRNPFPSEPYCFGLFDGLVHLFHSIADIENRYFEKSPDESQAFCSGVNEALAIHKWKALAPESVQFPFCSNGHGKMWVAHDGDSTYWAECPVCDNTQFDNKTSLPTTSPEKTQCPA